MQINIKIIRRKAPDAAPYTQTILWNCDQETNIATLLREINGPLKKFPVVRDLIVDRSVMRENLIAIHNWLEVEARHSRKNVDLAYDASRCIQCGCCLEVCPNFTAGDSFFGAAAFVPASRVLSELPKGKKYAIISEYGKHIYNGCGKSLSCHNICPVGIDVEHKLSNSNAVVVWKRFIHNR